MDQMSASSVISLRTVSDATGLEVDRKRVRRSSTGSKHVKKQDKGSPYAASTKSLPKKQPKRTGREMWVEAVQNGGGMSNEGKGTSTWRNGKPSQLFNATSATPFLREQLLLASGSPIQNRVSRPSSATAARVGGTGPIYKDAESYYDEIQMLKRQLRQLINENNQVKAKNVCMEDEIISKSKKIEELLNPEMQSNDIRRTLTSKKPNTSEVVMSVRRKVYKLEESLRDKEATVRKMKSDIKQTNVEELVIENQMFLYEINRLTQIVKEIKLQNTQHTISEDLINDALKGDTNGKKTQILLKRLTDDNQGLVLENKALKNDLMKLAKGNQAEVSKDYEDMSRNELLQKISSLEQRLKVEEKKASDGMTSEMTDSEAIDDRCIELKGPLPQQIKQLRARERELLSQVENLENTVKKLKEDRSHYRKKNDEYRQQLDNLKKKTDDHHHDHHHDVGSDTTSIKSEKSPKHRKIPFSGNKNSDRITVVKQEKVTESEILALQQSNAAKKIQRGWRKRQMGNAKGGVTKLNEEDELEDAIISIQASWRGHKARETYIESIRDEYNYALPDKENIDLNDDDVLLIQSTLRGHSSRKQLILNSSHPNLSKRSHRSVDEDTRQYIPSQNVEEETDDDDDVVIGSSASLSRYNINQRSHTDSSPSRSSMMSSRKMQERLANHVDGSSYRNKMEKNEMKFTNSHRNDMVKRENSLNNLKSSSSPWPESLHDDIESDDDELLSSRSMKMKKGSKKEEKLRKTGELKEDIADKWAKSGHKDSDNIGSFQKRLSMRRSTQLLKDFEADDDDDIVVGATFQKMHSSSGNKKALLDDELF